ncbi:hypothetical protein GCM10007079_08750 [Nocardiopsis terrae]|uniref:Uncharacterized protein n=1 Tax=Nocardiopsis terrae TaxID=372655 RepID=A0ABR9HCY6_9ACTN|nr:hypothetical protein [Nocardiopsis terrae]MBE1456908.1 hypothetical protein [Nocardiopsis terrae]GHC74466.1 hypothetical protein GCM10007079_08750 [Nocardiopsis terrae]
MTDEYEFVETHGVRRRGEAPGQEHGPRWRPEDIQTWDRHLGTFIGDLTHHLFARGAPRAAFTDHVRGLLADVDRKNSRQPAGYH